MKLRFFLLITTCVFVFPACNEDVATNQSEVLNSDTASTADGEGLIVSDSILESPEFSINSSNSLDSSENQIQLIEYSEELKGRTVELSGEDW